MRYAYGSFAFFHGSSRQPVCRGLLSAVSRITHTFFLKKKKIHDEDDENDDYYYLCRENVLEGALDGENH